MAAGFAAQLAVSALLRNMRDEPSSSSAQQTFLVSNGDDRPASSSLPTLADEHGRRHSLPNFAEWSVQHSATAEGRLGLIDAMSATPVARLGYLPDLEPLVKGSRSGAFVRRTGSEPIMPTPEASPDLTPMMEPLLRPGANPCKRWKDVFRQGSLWGTAFNMCSSTLGAGALSLPYAFQHSGVAIGLLLLALTAAATHYSVVLLVSSIHASGVRSFEDLTVHLFGKKMGLVVEVNIILFCFGSCIAYTMAIGDILRPVMRLGSLVAAWPWLGGCFSSTVYNGEAMIIVLFWLLLMVPLSLVEKIASLQWSSLLGVVSLVYLVFSVTVHACWSWAKDVGHANQDVKWAALSTDTFPAMAIFIFAFTCQINIPPLYEELQRRSKRRMAAVSRRCMFICVLCYAFIGVAGYVDFPTSQYGNILKNYPILSAAPDMRLMLPAFVAIAITVLVAYPVNMFPCRFSLDVLLFAPCGKKYGSARHIGITLVVATASLAIALYVPGIQVVFTLMGGTSSAFVCFMLPAAFAWKLDVPEARGWTGRAGCATLFLSGLLVGGLSTATTIVQLVTPDDGGGDNATLGEGLRRLAANDLCHGK